MCPATRRTAAKCNSKFKSTYQCLSPNSVVDRRKDRPPMVRVPGISDAQARYRLHVSAVSCEPPSHAYSHVASLARYLCALTIPQDNRCTSRGPNIEPRQQSVLDSSHVTARQRSAAGPARTSQPRRLLQGLLRSMHLRLVRRCARSLSVGPASVGGTTSAAEERAAVIAPHAI